MRVTCTNCGQGHPTWDCRAAKKSTGGERSGAQAVHGFSGGDAVRLGIPAVSDKPPVDTNPGATNEGLHIASSASLSTSLAGVEGDKTGTKFDKKAYMRLYMAEYRKGKRRRGTLTNPPPSPKPNEGKSP